MCQLRMLSPTGKCHTFGAGGDGFVPGEGVGAVLLKPLAAALRDRDHIYAVIKGSAVNHGGTTNGYTVPNPNAQALLIGEALKQAGIDPRTLSYVEAHGTGTSLGDPIEIAGLTKAFAGFSQDKQYCAIGSAKANIGHLEAAAGIAGLTRVILQMKHRKLVPSLHSSPANPNIDFPNSPFYVQAGLTPWQQPVIGEQGEEKQYPRRAAVSSFGAGGANAHVVLEEWTGTPEETGFTVPQTLSPHLICLSATNAERLNAYAGKLAAFLEETTSPGTDGALSGEALRCRVQNDLIDIAAAVRQVERDTLEANEELTEYGFDTVSLAAFIRRLQETYDIELAADLERGSTSIAGLTAYLCQAGIHRDALKRFYGQENVKEETSPRVNRTEPGPGLANIAYTLHVGREPREERLALVVPDLEALKEKLGRYCRGEEEIEQCYRGSVKTGKGKVDFLLAGEDGQEILENLLSKRKLNKLAQLWTLGAEIPWEPLYREMIPAPHRVALPTYPFSGARYWIPEALYSSPSASPSFLHPLLGMNTSTLREQRFTTWLTGSEFYLAHHVVAARKVLPGVAYLEMARAAGEIAAEARVCKIKNMIWAKPIILNGHPLEVHTGLYPGQEAGLVEIQVSTNGETGHSLAHARAKLVLANPRENSRGEERLDKEAIKNRCPRQISGEECYRLFHEAGLHYGPAFKPIRVLYTNGNEVLGVLELPMECREGFERREFILHPALMDGALQTVIGLRENIAAAPGQPYLPFAVAEVEIIKPLTERCYVYTAPAAERQESHGVKTFNIKLADETGQVVVRLTRFSIRESVTPAQPGKKIEADPLLKILTGVRSGELEVAAADRMLDSVYGKK
jgi:acyl transferase domain-containing protein/acyl carrier protein